MEIRAAIAFAVDYDNRPGSHPRQIDFFHIDSFPQVSKIHVYPKELKIEYNGSFHNYTTVLPPNIVLETRIEYRSILVFDPLFRLAPDTFSFRFSNPRTDILLVSWTPVPSTSIDTAEFYQLEWTFMPELTHLRKNLLTFRHNATVVTLPPGVRSMKYHYIMKRAISSLVYVP